MIAALEYIISIIGGGLLFAFIMMLFYGANSDSADVGGMVAFTIAMFVLGMIGAAYSLGN